MVKRGVYTKQGHEMIKQTEHEMNEREKKLYVESILENTFRFYKKEKEKLTRKRADCGCHPNQKCIYSKSLDNLKEAEEKAINGIVYLMWQPTPVVERDLKAVFEQPLDEAITWFNEKTNGSSDKLKNENDNVDNVDNVYKKISALEEKIACLKWKKK